MACKMAQGNKISLAPTVLGFVYHKLGEICTNKEVHDIANALFPIHLLVGWLGKHFLALYHSRLVCDFPQNYPLLAGYSGILAEITISQAWLVFRSEQHLKYYSNPPKQIRDMKFLHIDNLSLNNFQLLLSIRYASLPIRAGSVLWIEAYYPNRFARQFSFDHGVPDNDLEFSVLESNNCHISYLSIAKEKTFS
ncbi:hypothetical protein ACH5RR_022725 [Cinchona calisaya]|uniref:Aminotransferase-like plant mobile domain-containing protein n=1 Tax=Cinchona calisaya TaxID=153742 RepID=A0ABD2ZDK7_9GENT